MGINIKMITQASEPRSNRAGGFKAAWPSQELVYLVDLTVTFTSREKRGAGTAVVFAVPVGETKDLTQAPAEIPKEVYAVHLVLQLI